MVKYIGGHRYMTGLPRRDMTMDEWEAIDEDRRKRAVELGLYTVDDEDTHELIGVEDNDANTN